MSDGLRSLYSVGAVSYERSLASLRADTVLLSLRPDAVLLLDWCCRQCGLGAMM
jgi:hypothetical protein